MFNIQKIGFIGVGVMGEPMCRHLTKKTGKVVQVFDRDEAPLVRLAEAGAKTASIGEISSVCDVIFMSLPSGEIVEEVVLGTSGLLRSGRSGQILVDLSTSDVDVTRRIGAAVTSAGMYFADAPVMRTRQAAEAGTLAVPVGASVELFTAIEPLIRTFASDVMHVGDIGAGQAVKILNNMVLYETVLALAEARAVGVRVGIQPDVLFKALSVGSADSFALRNHGMKAIAPQIFPLKAFPVTYARKDLMYAVALSESVGVNATGAKNLITCFNQAIAQGHGDKYAPAISLVFEGNSF